MQHHLLGQLDGEAGKRRSQFTGNMEYPPELQAYWADLERWGEDRPDPHSDDWHVSPRWAQRFRAHLDKLGPLADEGNLDAQYAMASIYLVGLIYPDRETECRERDADKLAMTNLLASAARGGMPIAFDNLVVCGVGPVAEAARLATRRFEEKHQPDWCKAHDLPVYTGDWMAGAMELWMQDIDEQEDRDLSNGSR